MIGRIRYRICGHGKVLIEDYKAKDYCDLCFGSVNECFYVPDISPRFNKGLGCITYGTRDAEKKGKAKGLTPIGDVPLEKVFRNDEPSLRKQIVETYKQVKARMMR